MGKPGGQTLLIGADPTRGLRLPPGVRGDALFTDDGARRLWLSRWWGQLACPSSGFWLWVGMNPSKAGARVDDPTVGKEVWITKRHGGSAYVKCNVMDWIETESRKVVDVAEPCSELNVRTIMAHASRAGRIVCAWGSLHHTLRRHAETVLDGFLHERYELWCLGTTKDGSPKHPVYLSNSTKVVRYFPRT